MSALHGIAVGAVKRDTTVRERSLPQPSSPPSDVERQAVPGEEKDVFGDEAGAEIQYKTCKWWYVFATFLCPHGGFQAPNLNEAA